MKANVNWYYSNEKNGYVAQTTREILPGEEFLWSYGVKQNWRYLLDYGFILPNSKLLPEILLLTGQYFLSIKFHVKTELILKTYIALEDTKIIQAVEEIDNVLSYVNKHHGIASALYPPAWETLSEIAKYQLTKYSRSEKVNEYY